MIPSTVDGTLWHHVRWNLGERYDILFRTVDGTAPGLLDGTAWCPRTADGIVGRTVEGTVFRGVDRTIRNLAPSTGRKVSCRVMLLTRAVVCLRSCAQYANTRIAAVVQNSLFARLPLARAWCYHSTVFGTFHLFSNPFRAPKSLPILTSSKCVKKGFLL